MADPVLLAVDDDPGVSRAVERDLRRRYGERYRVVRVESGPAALDVLGRLGERSERVALLLVDQRMPDMTGTEFLARAMELVPEAKRVLLTAYADKDVAIVAINEIRLDHYLIKPWDPPEEHLYPVLDDLLDDWHAAVPPVDDRVRVVGHRFSTGSHRVRDFLTRNQVPYRWLDAATPAGLAALAQAGLEEPALPVVLFADGGAPLVAPETADVAARLGLRGEAKLALYDVVIVGAGPAGLAAAVYGATEGLRTVVVEEAGAGGQAGQSSRIENYLGFPSGLSGADLARRATVQARRFGAELLTARQATGIEARGPLRIVRLEDGDAIAGHTVVVASGVSYRRLEAEGVDELTGAGVYYGAAASEVGTCDDQPVVVVGAANSAGQAALALADRARSVTIICRGATLEERMSRYLVDRIRDHEGIRVLLETVVERVAGASRLETVTMSGPGGVRETLPAAGLFVFIGAVPHTAWLGDAVARDALGFVLAGDDLPEGAWPLERPPALLETSVPGVFVAGDVRAGSLKRVASAVGEGSTAIQLVHRYLASQ